MRQESHASGYCPSCGLGHIRKRGGAPWECRTCGHRFDKPDVRNRKPSTSGSGVIAPLPYRQQLARERLAESAVHIATDGNYYGVRKCTT